MEVGWLAQLIDSSYFPMPTSFMNCLSDNLTRPRDTITGTSTNDEVMWT